MELFGVGAMEALLVLVVALIVVGPHRFPGIARQGGRWYRVARRYANEVTQDVRGAMDELQAEIEEEGADLRSIRELGDEMEADLRPTTRAAQGAADAPASRITPDAEPTKGVANSQAGAQPDDGETTR